MWIHPADRHLLADPMAAISGESAAMLRMQFGMAELPEFAEPDDVRDAVGRRADRGRRPHVHRRPRARPHARAPSSTGSTTTGPKTSRELMFSGDFLFAGSIGRTDLTGGSHPQMQDSLRDRVLPLADDIVVLPGHGPQTSIGRERATNPFLAELAGMTRRLSGFPELLPAERNVELHVLDHLRRVFELHGFANIETRAVETTETLLRKGEIDKEVYVLRRLHAEGGRRRRRPRLALRPHRAVRALRARERRTSSSSRSGATRSRRCGAASGPSRAGSASSPRPTSTSSPRTSCRSTSTSRSRRSWPRRSAACRFRS